MYLEALCNYKELLLTSDFIKYLNSFNPYPSFTSIHIDKHFRDLLGCHLQN